MTEYAHHLYDIDELFADADMLDSPYHKLVRAEVTAGSISSAGENAPGLLRPLEYVKDSLEPNHSPERTAFFVRMMRARHEALAERLAGGFREARSIMALTAFESAGMFAGALAGRALDLMDAGYGVFVLETMPALGGRSATVLDSSVYEQFPSLPDGTHEAFYPDDAERAAEQLRAHEALLAGAMDDTDIRRHLARIASSA